MILVIIAGGSGTRLWPLSQSEYPKHLLALTSDNSMLQNTYERAKELSDNIFIITEASHAHIVAIQLPGLQKENIIIEPARRGTASCILLALAQIKSSHPAGEPVVFLHADHHIVDTKLFCNTVSAAAQASAKHKKITMIGLTPTHAATGLGYIQFNGEVDKQKGLPIYSVKRFKEKPQAALAEKYLEDGHYLWNLGLFAGSIEVFEKSIKKNSKIMHEYLKILISESDRITENYLKFDIPPIEFALIEKDKDLLVVPGSFEWADIGSYFDVHKILKGTDTNALRGDVEMIECEDSMIHGTDKPIVAIGLSGIVVVDTPEGLLVCAKEKSQLVGEAAKRLKLKTEKLSD